MGLDNKGFSWTGRGRMSKGMGGCERDRQQSDGEAGGTGGGPIAGTSNATPSVRILFQQPFLRGGLRFGNVDYGRGKTLKPEEGCPSREKWEMSPKLSL